MLKLVKQKFGLFLYVVIALPVLLSSFFTLVQPQSVSALDFATTQKCYDTFNGKDVIYTSLSANEQAFYNKCKSDGTCRDGGEGTLIDSRRINCTNPTELGPAVAAEATAAELAPFVTLQCGARPTSGDTALTTYSACADKAKTVFTRCSTSGGSATSAIEQSVNDATKCIKQTYPKLAFNDIKKAVEQGRKDRAAVYNNAITKANQNGCVEDTNGDGQPDNKYTPNANGGACDPVTPTNSDDCALGETKMRWLGCAIMGTAALATEKMYTLIQNFLYTPTSMIFDNPELKAASASLRNLAIGLILIAGLVMVIAQATGSDLVDAYTIRKLLPRIGVAIIGIALAWPLLEFAVTFINTIGLLADQLLTEIIRTGGPETSKEFGSTILSYIFGAGGVAIAFKLMSTALVPLAGTILLGMLVGLLVLAIRQLVLMVCILLAPLAIAAYVLPGTQKMWSLWKNTLITTLLMFPIIMFFLASGEAFAYVLSGSDSGTMTILAVIVFIAPYFMLPFAFKLAGGLMSTIFSIANDKGKGGFDRLRNSRQKMGAQHRERTIGRRVMQKRADYAGRLQGSASRAGRSGIGRRALSAAALGVGGYNIEAAMSGKREAVSKELNSQIATGADGEIRGLTVNKQHALRAGREGEDWRVNDGQRQFRTLGGAWVSEAEVDRGHARWGKDTFAQQTALSYEMRKANSEQDVRRISKGYKQVAQGPGGWGMSKYEATGSWIGAAFENQNQHLEYKKTNWETGELGTGGYNGFVDELYEKKGSYPLGQMHSSTIERLQEAYKEADVAIAKPGASASEVAALEDRKRKIESIAEMFVHDMGAGIPGSTVPGEEGKAPTVIEGERPIAGAGGRMVSAQGAAHTNERVFELAEMTGVLDNAPTTRHASPDVHSQTPRVNTAASPYETDAEKIANPVVTPPNAQTQKRRP